MKFLFGLFNLFLEANQIGIAENLYAKLFLILLHHESYLDVNFSLLHPRVHQFRSSDRDLNYLPFEKASLAGARWGDLLEIIQFSISLRNKSVDVYIVVNVPHVSNLLHLNVAPLQ